jgi:hypothetical protein
MLPADAGQSSKKPAGKLKSVDALFPFGTRHAFIYAAGSGVSDLSAV